MNVQVVIDDELLKQADEAASRQKLNRSAFVREAIEAHLKRLKIQEMEEQDRRAYAAIPMILTR